MDGPYVLFLTNMYKTSVVFKNSSAPTFSCHVKGFLLCAFITSSVVIFVSKSFQQGLMQTDFILFFFLQQNMLNRPMMSGLVNLVIECIYNRKIIIKFKISTNALCLMLPLLLYSHSRKKSSKHDFFHISICSWGTRIVWGSWVWRHSDYFLKVAGTPTVFLFSNINISL